MYTRRAATIALTTTAVTSAVWLSVHQGNAERKVPASSTLARPLPAIAKPPPSRADLLARLNHSTPANPTETYDILVIGGGATGAGIAVDAASRGLKVALLERDDFASGTSSRSTKLVHGGVRYLEKAVWNLDYSQYKLVREALHERKVFLQIAPHLAFALPIMIPVYKWWQVPYFWMGVKAYDVLAGKQNLESSYLLTRGKALEAFPQLNADTLKGAIVYYDGMHNDARMNVSLALSAVELGATVLNHVEVTGIEKDENGAIKGVIARDLESDQTIGIAAKAVVNATGPFCDAVRKLDDPKTQSIVAPSSGVHIILPGYYSSKQLGLLDAASSDGRVIFFLPWQGSTIAGTTDQPTSISANPIPSEQDIQFILSEVSHYFRGKIDVRREDVLAAWSGIRPLVHDLAAKNTESLVRNHLITVSESGLVTVAGGKWTTYRQMAQETVEECIKRFRLDPPIAATKTESLGLVGAQGWSNLLYIELIQQYNLTPDVAQHLSSNYGTRAFTVAQFLEPADCAVSPTVSPATTSAAPGKQLVPPYPFLVAEIKYAARFEYATTAVDFLARRTRLAFLDCRAAYEVLPAVIEVMGRELGWSAARRTKEYDASVEFLKGMGLQLPT